MKATGRLDRLFSAVLTAAVTAMSIGPAPRQAGAAEAPAPLPAPAAPRAVSVTQPASLAAPLAVTRAQSAYRGADAVAGTLVVTLTVSNLRPPASAPSAPAGATVTDTIAFFSGFDPTQDANTLRGLLVSDVLTPGVSLLSASHPVSVSGAALQISLGDLAPLSSLTVTLRVAVPSSSPDFIALDAGATAYATLQGRMATASPGPIVFAPDALGAFLIWTPDADTRDAWMLRALGGLGGSPSAMFEAVRAFGYESYVGSLRGTRGTLWSKAGNAIDKSSLLIAMLRASGVPARYRHGTLDAARTSELIGSMFPPLPDTRGYIPPGAGVFVPISNTQLISETRDHWWVEAYLPGGGWTNLDPSFASAAVGQTFHSALATDGTDQIAEIPDALRHKVDFRLIVERYGPFSFSAAALPTIMPLTASLNTVQLVGNPVSLEHFVDTNFQAGLVFGTVVNTYIPYLVIGDQAIDGTPFQDIISSFPLGYQLSTAEWLAFDLRHPGGASETYTRTIADLIGVAARAGGGTITNSFGASTGLVDGGNVYSFLFAPSMVPREAVDARYPALARAAAQAQRVMTTADTITGTSPSEIAALQDANALIRAGVREAAGAQALSFAAASDFGTPSLARGAHVAAYFDMPRVIIASQQKAKDAPVAEAVLDLARNRIRAVPYPGQTIEGGMVFNLSWGLLQTDLEHELLKRWYGAEPRGVSAVFAQARAEAVDIALLTTRNLSVLGRLPLSSEAKTRIAQTLDGRPDLAVIVPTRMITVSGQSTIGWYAINMLDGRVSDMLENGLHGDAVEYAFLLSGNLQNFPFAIAGFFHGWFAETMFFLAYFLEQTPLSEGELKGAYSSALESATASAENIATMIGAASAASGGGAAAWIDCYLDGCGFEIGFEWKIPIVDSPLPDGFGDVVEGWATLGGVTLPEDPEAGPCSISLIELSAECGDKLTYEWHSPFGFNNGVAAAEAFIGSHNDPPVPYGWVGEARFTPMTDTLATRVVTMSATHAGTTITGALLAPNVRLIQTDRAAFYAPAAAGLGMGGAYPGFSPFGLGGAATLGGARLMLGPSGAPLYVNGAAVSAVNGLALPAFSGALAMAESGAALDSVALTGTGTFFALAVSPSASAIAPGAGAVFSTSIRSNAAGVYTLTAEVPAGWAVLIAPDGAITASSPSGAAAGDYLVLVVAQSAQAPDVFASAIHTVTVSALQAVAVAVAPDPLHTMSWGDPGPGEFRTNPNNGQMQLSGAAWTVAITNSSNAAHTFAIGVSGLPVNWGLLSASVITLSAGAVGHVGLAISPTAPLTGGASYPFTISASATDMALSASDGGTFVAPASPYAWLNVPTHALFAAPGGATTFSLTLKNVGNAAGAFPLTMTIPAGWAHDAPGLLNANPGETRAQTVTVTTTGTLFSQYVVRAGTRSLGYEQSAYAVVILVTPHAACVFNGGAELAALGDAAVTTALSNLGTATLALEQDPASAPARAAVVAAINTLVGALAPYPEVPALASLTALASAMPGHTGAAQIDADLTALCGLVVDLGAQTGAAAAHAFSLSFNPGADAALPGRAVSLTFSLANRGTLSTSFNVTLTSPALGGPILLAPTLAAGASATQTVVVTSAVAAFVPVYAAVSAATGAPALPMLSDSAIAGVSFISPLLQVFDVAATPGFVDFGTSATSLSARIANVGNWRMQALATLTVIGPSGGTSATLSAPVTLAAGNPTAVNFGSLNTSGFQTGTYTLTVSALVTAPAGLSGFASTDYGYFSVGQALYASGAVAQPVVAPGNVTATVFITTFVNPDGTVGLLRPARPSKAADRALTAKAEPQNGIDAPGVGDAGPQSPGQEPPAEDAKPQVPQHASPSEVGGLELDLPTFATSLLRTEAANPLVTRTGTWTSVTGANLASGASYSRSSVVSSTMSFTFTGSWVSLGYLAGSDGRQFEVFLDGASQGVIDSYANKNDLPQSRLYSGLVTATHVISVFVLSTKNGFALATTYAKIDFFDTWDGTSLSDGVFEHSSPRLILGSGWTTQTLAGASGGSYGRGPSGSGVAWFAFTGDSVAYQLVRDFSTASQASVYVDGIWKADIDMATVFANASVSTATIAFDGLGAGAHVLSLVNRRGSFISLDTFATPGVAPFYAAPILTGVVRYEENHPALRYNGMPLTATKTAWFETVQANASGGWFVASSVASDTVGLTFSGTWASLGYVANTNAGRVEIFIDGASRGVIDTYANQASPRSAVFSGLAAGAHTLTATVLGTRNAFASTPGNFDLDYIDVWDGATLPDGRFEEDSPRVWYGTGWDRSAVSGASGGSHATSQNTIGATWFAFTGDSVSYHTLRDFNSAGTASVFVDGVWKTDIDLNTVFANAAVSTYTLSFDGLGAGPHVLTVDNRRGSYISLDAVTTPGIAPFYVAPVPTGVIRYEENHPALRYNGAPFTATKTSWTESAQANASAGRYAASSTLSDTLSLTFSGTWASLGYVASANAGRVEVFIDGASQGVIDTYGRSTWPRSRVYAGLAAGAHTLTVTVLGTRNAFASAPGNFDFDYLDVWDGTTLPDGSFEEDSPRVWYGSGWNRGVIANASGGAHATSQNSVGAAWFAFTGDSVTWQFMNGFSSAGRAGIEIDGVDLGVFDLGTPFTGTTNFTRALSFGGLGAGPHVAMVWLTRGSYASIDAFATPGVTPFYTAPARSGIVRYEEDDPALRYNGVVYSMTKQTWAETSYGMASDGYVRYSATASDTLSMAFTGTWASLGYVARANGGRAEIFIDGASQGVVDTYGREDDARSVVFPGLSAGPHVISLTALGTRNAFAASPGYVHFDHIDVGDGSALSDGVFDESSPRVRYSDGWSRAASASAEGGYYANSPNATGAAWVAFAGDSIRLATLAGLGNAGELGVYVDGRWKGWLDLDAPSVISRSAAFGGLSAGPHVMALVSHRGSYFNLDTVTTPASAPFFDAGRSGVFRLEEDDPAIRLNGAPYTQTKSSWDYLYRAQASDRYVARSSAPSDTFSLNFDGAWVSLGFATRADGRQAEVFLDGASQGVVDTYSAADDVLARVYGGLVSATHVISFNVLSTFNVSATGSTKYLQLDSVDVWDGNSEPKGVFQHDPAEQFGGRVYRSDDWTISAKTNTLSGTFLEDGTNAWFLFTGVSVTVIGVTDALTPSTAEILVDGVSQGVLDLNYPFARSSVATTIGGLGAGAHVLRFVDRSGAGSNLGASLDAFQTGDVVFAGMPMVEWSAKGSESSEIFAITPAVGDLNGDGIPEIVASTTGESCIFGSCTFTNKALYVFEGDTGALVFSRTITGTSPIGCGSFAICGGVGSPAIADLDGGGDIEIVVDSSSGLRAYKNDGALLWWNQNIKGTWASAVALGNLDDDDAPEIVAVNDSYAPTLRRLHIVQPDGATSWTYTLPTTLPGPRMPVLADLNGDTRLDLVIASGQTLYEFLNNGVSMTLAYTRSSGLDHYGSPAIADIDADGLPEIVIGWEGIVQAYEHDLTPKWVYTTGGVYPSTVSIAELDGNDGGAPEIVLYSKTSAAGEEGRVFALNHDGTLLWSQPAKDTTVSSAGVAVLDLDGDGAWEVVWNGSVSGTLIFKGATGEIQFNDDVIRSGTLNETPVIADVDVDGHAELVLVSGNTLAVLGYDAAWASSRPVWNQHAYHITNINDDLTVPVREPDSWAYHNTYRTQSPLTAPAPVYYIEISHTLAPSVTVVPGSFSRVYTDANPVYAWGYKHYWYEPGRVTRFDIALAGMQPGEVRRVSEGTVVSYTVGAGRNIVRIPPLYAAAAHIVNLSPQSVSVQRGATARIDVALTNPRTTSEVYTLTLAGLPTALAGTLPETVSLAGGATVTVALDLAAPASAELGGWEIVVNAANAQGGHEAALATVTAVDALRVSVSPEAQNADTGAQAAYTVVITNLEAVARTYSVTLSGLGANPVSSPPTISVGAGLAGSLPVTITAMSNESSLVFSARVTNTATGVSALDDAVLNIVGTRAVTAAFVPTTATAGLANDGYLTLTLENIGTIGDTYDLTLTARPDWLIAFERSGSLNEEQALQPSVLDAYALRVRFNPNFADGPGTYTITALARSRENPAVTAVAYARVTILDEAVFADLSPYAQEAAPGSVVTWTLNVANTGNVATTYLITGAGELGGLMQFGALSVTLAAGLDANVPVTATIPAWALGGSHEIQAWVWAQFRPEVGALAVAELVISATASLTASLSPSITVVADATPVDFAFVLTNTGDLGLEVTLSITSTAEVSLSTPALLVPSRFGALAIVSASAPRAGVYPITVTATSSAGSVSATVTLIRTGRAFIPIARK